MEDSIVSGEFSNKVAVVTGGSRGIGREISQPTLLGLARDRHCCLRRLKISRRQAKRLQRLGRYPSPFLRICARSMAVRTCSISVSD